MTHGTNKYSTVISINYEIPYEVISFIFHISQAQVKKGMNFTWRKNNSLLSCLHVRTTTMRLLRVQQNSLGQWAKAPN
jgi:hypothetical protein